MAGRNVLAVVEYRPGGWAKSAREVLGEARRLAAALGGAVTAVVLTDGAREAAPALGSYGAGRVYVGEGEAFAVYHGDLQGPVVAALARREEAALVLMAASAQGKDLGPRVAEGLEAGLAVDVVSVEADAEGVQAVRPVYAGKAMETLRLPAYPAVVSLRPNVFPRGEGAGGGEAEVLPVPADAIPAVASKVVEVEPRPEGKIELTEADIIVSGGRGLRGPENFRLVEELAAVLGAAVGASRAVVDAGWRPHEEQVGQTGKTVSPNLYVACGISGAIQHLAGMSSSKCIVAVNKDPEAPIFKVADYGIVGDVFEVLPALTEELRKVKG